MPVTSEYTIDLPVCSLPDILFKSPTHPLRDSPPSFIDPERPDTHYLTAASHRLWSQRFALGLRRLGVRDGDRILLYSANDLFYPVVFMGTIMAGAIFTGSNPNYVAREVAYQLRDAGAFCLICAEDQLNTGLEAASQAGLPRDRVFVFNNKIYDGYGSDVKGCKYWGSILASPEDAKNYQWPRLNASPDQPNTTLALNYSSGTTGVPKGVEITHRNYVANLLQYNHRASLDPDFPHKNARARWVCFLPMYHAMAQTIFVACAFLRGIPVYVMPKFDFIALLNYIQKFRITDFITVPPIAVALAKADVVKQFDLSSIETMGCGAAPLGSEISREVEALWPPGQINIKQGWGMTEVTCSLLGWNPTHHSSSNSVGVPNANCSAKLMQPRHNAQPSDPTNPHSAFEEVPPYSGPEHRGELWVKGPNVMKGYWHNSTATAATLTPDGWLRTGDIAYIDAEGRFYIVDRMKELIKVKGLQVAPAELEALLLEHPDIADAAVCGVPWGDDDERPMAWVVIRAGGKAGEEMVESIKKWVEERTSRHKWLEGGVEFLDAVPKNPSGKILRKELKERVRRRGGAKL